MLSLCFITITINSQMAAIQLIDNLVHTIIDCNGLDMWEERERRGYWGRWKKWSEMAGLLTDKRTPLRIRGSAYESCIRSVMLYGSETWAMTKKDEDILRKCDRRMLRYMERVKWQDGVSSEEVARRCGLGDILERARHGRLQWLWHVRREGEEGVLSKVEKIQVIGNRLPGRPKGTLDQLVQRDMNKKGQMRRLNHVTFVN